MRQENLEDPVIETGLIIDVDVVKWTVDVGTQHSDKQLFGIPWFSPYLHPETGEGINIMPEVGAQCLICTPSDGDLTPFVLGYLPIPDKDSFRSKRIDMNQGDISITTRDGNYVIARRGGVVQIGATKAAQRLYLPVANTIVDMAQNYRMHTSAGDWTWQVDPDSRESNGTPARWVLRAKQYAEDSADEEEYHAVVMTVGRSLPKDDKRKGSGEDNLQSISGAGRPLVELDISLSGEVGFNLAVDGLGNVFIKSGGAAQWDIEKDFVINVGGDRRISVTNDDVIEANKIIRKATSHRATWKTSEEVFTTKLLKGTVSMGNITGGAEYVIRGETFLRLLKIPGVFQADKTPCVPGPAFAALEVALSKSVSVGK